MNRPRDKIRASRVKKRFKMCFRKKRFSEEKAKFVVKNMKRRKVPGNEFLHSYLCPICSHWHVGKDQVSEEEYEEVEKQMSIKKKRCMKPIVDDLDSFGGPFFMPKNFVLATLSDLWHLIK